MKIVVIKKTITVTKDETLIEKSDKSYNVKFNFDETWDGFTKVATFKAGTYMEDVTLVNDECIIPSECLDTPGLVLKVLVAGEKNDDTISTPWCNISRILYKQDKIYIPRSCIIWGNVLDKPFESIGAGLSVDDEDRLNVAEILSPIDILAALRDVGMIDPIVATDTTFFTDSNNRIYSL